MKIVKNLVNQVRDKLVPTALSLTESKLLAMLVVIHSDNKNPEGELHLLKALCAFDTRLEEWDLDLIRKIHLDYKYDTDKLFEHIAESIIEKDDRLGVLATSFLLALIDGEITPEENKMLKKLGNAMRLTLEEMNSIQERSEYIVDTLKELKILV